MGDFARLGTFNMVLPPEGPKVFPNKFTFADKTEHSMDFTLPIQQGFVSFIQGAYVDNSTNPDILYISCEETGQVIPFPARSAGYVPLMLTAAPVFTLSSKQNPQVRVQVIPTNVPVTPFIWSVS